MANRIVAVKQNWTPVLLDHYNKRDCLSAHWIPQGSQWVDPKKEFDAMLTAIRAGLLLRSEAITNA